MKLLVYLIAFLIVGETINYRLTYGAAPAYLVFPSIFASFVLIVGFFDFIEFRKKGRK